MSDPCGEDSHMPVPGLVHRYPDRVLFLLTDRCASYCRYCTRSRVVSGAGNNTLNTDFEQAFQYLENTPSIRDVLFSGGDPLLYSDDKLEKIISRIHKIKHIEFIRIGTRIPIFLPQRITPSLCNMLKISPSLDERSYQSSQRVNNRSKTSTRNACQFRHPSRQPKCPSKRY